MKSNEKKPVIEEEEREILNIVTSSKNKEFINIEEDVIIIMFDI
jgi:hypothetical protein